MLSTAPADWLLTLADEAATARLAEDVASVLRAGDVVRLSGDLGTGKTSFARALIRALACDPVLEVPSPTFPIRIDYAFPRLRIAHLDLYRVAGVGELDELAIDEAVAEGALLVEWPELLAAGTGAAELDLALSIAAGGRCASLRATPELRDRLERSFAVRRFLERSGAAGATRCPVVGDASTRAYERIVAGDGTAILMNAPARPEGPPLECGRSYDAVAHRALDVGPFIAIGALLQERGVRVPRSRACDTEAGLLLLEDLGAETIADAAGAPVLARYEAAIDLLAAMHGQSWPGVVETAAGRYRVPAYDRDALLVEVSLFADWVGNGLQPDERAAFLAAWGGVLDKAGLLDDTLVLRDFHSPNILWQETAAGTDRIGVLDFQDAVLGDPAYDVASLAQDARVDIDAGAEAALVSRYVAARRTSDPGFDEARFARAYRVLAAQRATKVMGAFHRLAIVDGKTGYRRHLDHVKALLRRNLADPVLSSVAVWYEPYLA